MKVAMEVLLLRTHLSGISMRSATGQELGQNAVCQFCFDVLMQFNCLQK